MDVKQALVTGGAGFIGSHLCELLLARGWRVTALDDLSTGRVDNVRALEGREDFRLIVGSASDWDLVREVAARAHTVFHLAAAVGVRKVMDDPVGTVERNLHATETVLRASNQYRLRLLLASTSEVYGASRRERFNEDDDCLIGRSRHRRWAYAAAKLMDEFHAFAYRHANGLEVTIARLFNTVGPRQVGRYGMVVPTFARQAVRGEPLTVYGDGRQRRCFTAVADVVRCLADLAERRDAAGEVFNVGSDNEISILDLAERIRELAGSRSPVVFKTYAEAYGEDFNDMERRRPDVSKLRAFLGYVPETPLDAILRAVLDDVRAKND